MNLSAAEPSALASPIHSPAGRRSTSGPQLCLLLALLSLASSAIVGAWFPRHVPRNHDEFAYLLAGQTFARLELTNPTPPLWRFFEAPHLLLEPSYMAKYPPGRGLMIAVGIWLGNPIYGVWLEAAFFTAAIAWALLAFFPMRWAVLGGLAVITQLGLTHYWVQSYWGGALAAGGGALVFGAARRIWQKPCTRPAMLMGVGTVVLMLSRPFEGLLACLVPGGVLLVRGFAQRWPARVAMKVALPFAGVVLAGGLFLAYYQFRVTGSPWHSPYLEYERQYSSAPLFIWHEAGAEPALSTPLLRDFYTGYVLPLSRHYAPVATVFFERLQSTAGGFLGLMLASAALIGVLWKPDRWLLFALASLFVISSAFVLCYWFALHYQAPAAALYVVLAVAGLRKVFFALPRRRRRFGLFAGALVSAQLVVFASTQAREGRPEQLRATTIRQRVMDAVRADGRRHLIFVRLEQPYDPGVCWVYNDVPLDSSSVLWAWDRGNDENNRLLTRFSDRTAVLMTLRGTELSFVEYPPTLVTSPP